MNGFMPPRKSSVFLDDIYVKDESCLPSGDCDFESGDTCTWSNDLNLSNIPWQIDSGDDTKQNRPLADHTFGDLSGSYLFIEFSKAEDRGEVAFLSSEVFQYSTAPKGRCFTFWYYMKGVDMGSLSVQIVDKTSQKYSTVWRLSGKDLGDGWNYGSIGFYVENEYFIRFIGVSGGAPGSIAIDDLMFLDASYCSLSPSEAYADASLPVPVTTTVRPPTANLTSEFDCDFEKGLCNWQVDRKNGLEWKRARGELSGAIMDRWWIIHWERVWDTMLIWVRHRKPRIRFNFVDKK